VENVTESYQKIFPDRFDQIKHYFKYNTTIVNSDNKQIQMFVVILDVIIQNFNEILQETSQNEESCLKCLSILDAIYVDFCKHLSLNSNYVCKYYFIKLEK
jgi:hypothetical protein